MLTYKIFDNFLKELLKLPPKYIIKEADRLDNLAFNCEFLISAIKTIESTNIEIYYTGQVSHFFISSHNTNYPITHVIMPIVMNN